MADPNGTNLRPLKTNFYTFRDCFFLRARVVLSLPKGARARNRYFSKRHYDVGSDGIYVIIRIVIVLIGDFECEYDYDYEHELIRHWRIKEFLLKLVPFGADPI